MGELAQRVGELALPLAQGSNRERETHMSSGSTVELTLVAWVQESHLQDMRVGELAPPIPGQSWRAGPSPHLSKAEELSLPLTWAKLESLSCPSPGAKLESRPCPSPGQNWRSDPGGDGAELTNLPSTQA